MNKTAKDKAKTIPAGVPFEDALRALLATPPPKPKKKAAKK
jgi:hypothetical protein